MLFSRRTPRLLAAVVVSFLVASPSARAAEPADAATAYVKTVIADAVHDLTGPMATEERAKRLLVLIHRHGDMPGVPREIIGRFWTKLSPEQQTSYVSLFEDYAVLSYVGMFADYPSGTRVDVKTAELHDGKYIVHSESLAPNDDPTDPTRVDWYVVETPEHQFRVTNAVVDGVSMVGTLHSDFVSIIHSNGGSVEALIDALKAKIATYRKP